MDRRPRPRLILTKLRFTARAQRDLAALLRSSTSRFGEATADRYRALLILALADIRADPARHGVRIARKDESAVLLYHLKSVRRTKVLVARPRHFIAFRQDGEVVTVLRVLHERMDIPAHLR